MLQSRISWNDDCRCRCMLAPPATNPQKAATPAGGSAASASAAAPRSAFFLTEEQRQRIHTVAIAPSTYRPTIVTTGTAAFDGDRSTPVLTQISGPVAQILVTTGTRVQPGAALARVTSPDFAQAMAAFQKAQTALRNTTRIALLDEQLYKDDAIARSDLDQARSDSASAWADREAAIEQMVAFGVDSSTIDAIREGRPSPPAPGVIRAPIAGVVVEKLINPGQVVQAGQTQAFTIADLSTMWVMANVFESNLADVSAGRACGIDHDPTHGRIRCGGESTTWQLIRRYGDARLHRSAIVVQNRHELLKRDMYVRVSAIRKLAAKARGTGILAPVSSGAARRTRSAVRVLGARPNGGYDRRSITLGSRVG